MPWRVVLHDERVVAELEAQSDDMRARFVRIANLIEIQGLERVREPYVKHIEGKLWEMRMKSKAGIARALYVTASGQRVVVVHIFAKKTAKTPRRAIRLALQRAEDVS